MKPHNKWIGLGAIAGFALYAWTCFMPSAQAQTRNETYHPPYEALYNPTAFPHDWTNGVGTLGASGEIDLPAITGQPRRQWIYVQNQGAGTLKVEYQAVMSDLATTDFVTILLAPGSAINTQGSSDERGIAAFIPQGAVKVIGTANQPVAILEVVE